MIKYKAMAIHTWLYKNNKIHTHAHICMYIHIHNSYNTSMRLVSEFYCDSWGQSVYKLNTNQMNVLKLLCFMVGGSKAPLACSWHKKEWFYTVGPVLEWCKWCTWWKTLGSMLLSQKGLWFAMLTCVTFLVVQLSIYIPLTLLTSWLFSLYTNCALHG